MNDSDELAMTRHMDALDAGSAMQDERENDVIDSVCDDGDDMDLFIDILIDDTSALREIVLVAARMHARRRFRRAARDEAEVGRRFLAYVHCELEKFAESEAEQGS